MDKAEQNSSKMGSVNEFPVVIMFASRQSNRDLIDASVNSWSVVGPAYSGSMK